MTGIGDNSGSPRPDEASAGYRFSTDELPAADRVAIFREVVGKQMARLDIEPLPAPRFQVSGAVRALPGLFALWTSSSPVRAGRTPRLIPDDDDSYIFQWVSCAGTAEQRGREAMLAPCDAVLFLCSEPGSTTLPSSFETVSIKVPRAAIRSRLRDEDACLARPISGNFAPLKLLLGYLEMLREPAPGETAELRELAVAHVYDLLAHTLGATRDAAESARLGGVRAARLAAIKADICENLSDGSLSVEAVASRHRLTPRSLQLLFECDGTTFTQFVCERRLLKAYRMLVNGRFGGSQIGEIAYDCGFNDVSYFNRQFRARYGATPSDVRNGNNPT